MFSLICGWTNGWVNNGEAGDLRRHRVHYDVIMMSLTLLGWGSFPTLIVLNHIESMPCMDRTVPIWTDLSPKRPHWAMMTSSNGNIFRVTGHLCGEFTGPGEFPAQRPVTRSFDVFFDLRLNKRLSKQPWGWWFETPSWSLWRHRYGITTVGRSTRQYQRNNQVYDS